MAKVPYTFGYTQDGRIYSAVFEYKMIWGSKFYSKGNWKPHTRHDTQRSKVYKAEHIIMLTEWDHKFDSFRDACKWTAQILSHKWLHDNFRLRGRTLMLTTGMMRTRACYKRHWDDIICLPTWARSKCVILHELAHALDQYQGHGRQFCQIYLLLVKHYLGKPHYLRLRQSFTKHKVRYKSYKKGSKHLLTA